jgi:hypothetical protein
MLWQGNTAPLESKAQVVHLEPGKPQAQPKLPGNRRFASTRYATDQQYLHASFSVGDRFIAPVNLLIFHVLLTYILSGKKSLINHGRDKSSPYRARDVLQKTFSDEMEALLLCVPLQDHYRHASGQLSHLEPCRHQRCGLLLVDRHLWARHGNVRGQKFFPQLR